MRIQLWAACWLLLPWLVHGQQQQQAAVVISSISPSQGSLAGGTRLQITGSGFSADRFSGVGNIVQVGKYPCQVLNHKTTDTLVSTYQPASTCHTSICISSFANMTIRSHTDHVRNSRSNSARTLQHHGCCGRRGHCYSVLLLLQHRLHPR